MSRVGKKLINLPSGVEVTFSSPNVTVKGPKGTLSTKLNNFVDMKQEEIDGVNVLSFSIENESNKEQRAQWGTARAVVANLVQGVNEGFKKSLEVVGVGYKASVNGSTLLVSAGYSHDVPFLLPEGIGASVEGNVITISGNDRQTVGQVAAEIRKIRKPEPYKGKGIKYVGEHIRRKAGKSAKAGE